MNKIFSFLMMLLITSVASADLLKVSKQGKILELDKTKWACVLDEDSALYWEVKSDKEGVQYAHNTYTWFDGETGDEDGEYSRHCYWGMGCNTQHYVEEINSESLCSFNDWRIPSVEELKTLVNYYSDADALIDVAFFPNTQANTYWTSTTVENNEFVAYEVPFVYGGSIARDKYFDTYIRLVRSSAEQAD
ncbi:MAG: DUF1566 domain-containing protein [Gammaproteobacteria bacterium]|nr:DUF1566 domain-containing protein [Gammaproteobacteria bacterium]